jgi:serine/threonine protein kinase
MLTPPSAWSPYCCSLTSAGKASPSLLLEILIMIAKALKQLHVAGVIHCDVKIDNILFCTDSGTITVKVREPD